MGTQLAAQLSQLPHGIGVGTVNAPEVKIGHDMRSCPSLHGGSHHRTLCTIRAGFSSSKHPGIFVGRIFNPSWQLRGRIENPSHEKVTESVARRRSVGSARIDFPQLHVLTDST